MVNSDPLVGLSIGDTADLTPTDFLPVIAEPDTKPPLDNIVAFTVNMTRFGGSDTIRDDYIRDDGGTGASGKTLTDPQDLSQTPLLQHAYSQFLAILIDVSSIDQLHSLNMAGIDLDHSEVWNFQYFNTSDQLIHQIIIGPGTSTAGDGAAFPVSYTNSEISKAAVWGAMNLNQRERIGFAIDNICIEAIDQDETAWGTGLDFPGKNWATYFTYFVQAPNPECEGATCETFDQFPCGPDGCSNPICATIVEGGGVCVEGLTSCDATPNCVTSDDCPTGALCAVDTCCGDHGECAMPWMWCVNIPDTTSLEALSLTSSGPTWGCD